MNKESYVKAVAKRLTCSAESAEFVRDPNPTSPLLCQQARPGSRWNPAWATRARWRKSSTRISPKRSEPPARNASAPRR